MNGSIQLSIKRTYYCFRLMMWQDWETLAAEFSSADEVIVLLAFGDPHRGDAGYISFQSFRPYAYALMDSGGRLDSFVL